MISIGRKPPISKLGCLPVLPYPYLVWLCQNHDTLKPAPSPKKNEGTTILSHTSLCLSTASMLKVKENNVPDQNG